MAGAHLVGHRADAADAGGDVGHLGDGTAPQERLEEPRRFEDAQLHVVHPAIAQADGQRSLPLDARHGRDADGPRRRTGPARLPR